MKKEPKRSNKRSNKKSKTKSTANGKLSRKKNKMRQTGLSFKKPQPTPPPTVADDVFENHSNLNVQNVREATVPKSALHVIVTSPVHFRREDSYNASPVPFSKINVGPTSNTSVQKTPEANDSTNLQAPSKQPQPEGSTSSPPETPIRSTKIWKRTVQNLLDDFFQPTSSNEPRSGPQRVESDSESDNLDQIQFEEAKLDEQPKDSDNESDIIGPRVRRQRYLPSSSPPPVTANSPTQDNVSSDEELSQELRDITSSAKKSLVLHRMRDAHSRNKQKSRFQKELKNLMKKKKGLQDESDEEEEEAEEENRGLYDSVSEVESVASEDFIVEDEQTLNLEELDEIPPEFTSVSYQGPQHNFKVVVQAEVYAVLHPDYHNLDYSQKDGVDPYFKQAYKSLERQISGITDSAISSNAWKPWFVKTLKERPEFESEPIPGDLADCDACNVTKRHATYLVRMAGPKYNHRTLEVIAFRNAAVCYWDNENKQFLNETDVDEDDLEEGVVRKINLDKEWALGQFCHHRAEIAHYFYHWRYHLREQVTSSLRHIHWLSQDKKEYVENLPSDLQYKTLEDVIRILDRKRHIARMYNEYRSRIAMAREYLTGGGKGWKSSPQAKRFIRG